MLPERTFGLTWIALVLLGGSFVACGLGQWHADVADRNLARQLEGSGVQFDATLLQISARFRHSETVVVTLPTATGELRAALVGRTLST